MSSLSAQARLWWQKWRWYERNALPWRRARIHWHALRGGYFVRFPIQGNVLEALEDGRLAIGENSLLEPQCWITISEGARVRIGAGSFLNIGTMIAAGDEVTVGDHVMFANGCFVGDSDHRYDDPTMPITWQGFTSKGPIHIGSNCWFGANCVVTSGVTIGDRCVIGANSVVTSDLPPGVIAVGSPARVLKEIAFQTPGELTAPR